MSDIKEFELITCDVPTKTNLIYPSRVFENALEKVKFPLTGEIHVTGEKKSFDDFSEVDNNRVSHQVTSIVFDPITKVATGKIKILETPEGLKLCKMINNQEVAFRLRGLVKKNKEIDGHERVTYLDIISFDALDKKNAA